MSIRTTKLEKAQALADRLIADRATSVEKIAELEAQELELRRTAIRQNPSKRSDWQGARGDAEELKRKRQKLEDSIAPLDREIRLVAEALEALREAEAQAVFEAALAGLAEFEVREKEHIDRIEQAHAAFTAEHAALHEFYAQKREYVSAYVGQFPDQGRSNQLRAAAEPTWRHSGATLLETFERLGEQAAETAEAPSDIWYHKPAGGRDEDLVAWYNQINRARQAGISTQPLPKLPPRLLGKPEDREPEVEPEVEDVEDLTEHPVPRHGTLDWRAREKQREAAGVPDA